MKNRILFLALALVIIFSLILVGCGTKTTTTAQTSTAATTSPATVYKLKYADQNSNTGWEGSNAAQPWLDQITKATNGAVQFETYYAQTLFKGGDAWVSTKNGVADLAWMFHGYWANQTSLADVMSLPFLGFKSAKQASGIFWQIYEKYPSIREQFKDNHVLVTWTSDPYFLITNKKQVKTVNDIKGLQIRVPSGPPTEVIKALGAVPVSKGMPDTFLALEKGEIDGMAASWEAIVSFKLYDVVKYYTYMPAFVVYFTQAMNNDKWASLPADIQKQIESVSALKGSLFWGENMFDSAKIEGKNLIQKSGAAMTEYTLNEAEQAQWKQVTEPLIAAWVQKMTDAGHPEAKEILSTVQELIKTYNP
jgi:TRAP-type transport system periplasmic protein